VHAINFVSLPWPRRRCSAHTRTHTTEVSSPCFTYLSPCSTFRRAVTANPYAPAHVCPSSHRPQVRTFLATLTLNTASPKSARCAHVSVLSPCTRHRFCVAPVARPPTFAPMRTHTLQRVEPLCSPCPIHVRTPARVRLCLPSQTSAHARTHARERASTPAWTP
jgi:hypothetical protein